MTLEHMTRTTLTSVSLALLAALAAPPPSAAQMMMGPDGLRHGPPAFLQHLYSPRLIMRSEDKIGLTADQRHAISDAVAETRTKLTDLEQKRSSAAEALDTATAGTHVDEKTALEKAAGLIAVEQDIKQAHLRLLIRVKNELTAEQQKKLDGMRDEWQATRRQRLRDRLDRLGPAQRSKPSKPSDQ
jgi:Spy/CpxP family protein refolding chaperone